MSKIIIKIKDSAVQIGWAGWIELSDIIINNELDNSMTRADYLLKMYSHLHSKDSNGTCLVRNCEVCEARQEGIKQPVCFKKLSELDKLN